MSVKKTTNIDNSLISSDLPNEFISEIQKIMPENWHCFIESLSKSVPISIRLNPFKSEKYIFEDYKGENVDWASYAYYLKVRPSFTLDPLFHAGHYYVQEAASMYLEQIIKKHIATSALVLDLCAAPGGKSTHLSSILSPESLLVSNEVIRSRVNILSENMIKWGNPSTIVLNNDPSEIGKSNVLFDVIVADVPCSGEGMFRKDRDAIKEWSLKNVQLCAERQKRIIADIWPALKPEGILIYSTCTYNQEENEKNIDWICENLSAEIIEEPHRFMPHITKGEGFFIAAMRKKGGNDFLLPKKKKRNKEKTLKISEPFCSWILHPEDYYFIQENNLIIAIPNSHLDTFENLKQLKIINAGIILGEIKGKDIIPAHSLAMSTKLNSSFFPRWDLKKEDALRYLRKEVFMNIPANLPKGYILVTYQDCPLGFVKNIGSRANNLYPNEWRIRMKIENT